MHFDVIDLWLKSLPIGLFLAICYLAYMRLKHLNIRGAELIVAGFAVVAWWLVILPLLFLGLLMVVIWLISRPYDAVVWFKAKRARVPRKCPTLITKGWAPT